MLLPITLHMLFLCAWWDAEGFNDWVSMSVLGSGLAHLALVLLVIVRGRALVAGRPAVKPLTIYVATVAVSCVPFIIFIFPPVIVAVTGLPFLWLLRAMERVVVRERAELAHAPRVPPRAVVI